MNLPESLKPQADFQPTIDISKASTGRSTSASGTDTSKTPASYTPGSALLGANASSADVFTPAKDAVKSQTSTVENKNSSIGIIGRGLAAIPSSIGKGLTSNIDKTIDTPSYIAKAIADRRAEKTGGYTELLRARKANEQYEKARDTHVLGDKVKDWEARVDARQQAIMDDNPNSKLAETVYKATELGEAAGAMIPTVALSAGVGAAAAAVKGGAAALTAAKAFGTAEQAAKATKALSVASRIGEAAGLSQMALGVYSSSVDESMKQGADFQKASVKGFLDASLEVGTEMMFGGILGIGEGVIDRAAKKAASKTIEDVAKSTAKTGLIQKLGVQEAVVNTAKAAVKVINMADAPGFRGFLVSALGEGAEEMVSEWVGPAIERLTTNPDAEPASFGQIIEAGLGGAILSMVMGGAASKIQGRIQERSLDKALVNAQTEAVLNDNRRTISFINQLNNEGIRSEVDFNTANRLGLDTEGHTKTVVDTQRKGILRRPTEVVTGHIVDPLKNSQNKRVADLAIQSAIDAGYTDEATARAVSQVAEVWANEAKEIADYYKAQNLNKSIIREIVPNDAKVSELQTQRDELEQKITELNSVANPSKEQKAELKELRSSLDATEKSLNEERENARVRITEELNTDAEKVVEEYGLGPEVLEGVAASKRWTSLETGRFVAPDPSGANRVYTKAQYAEAFPTLKKEEIDDLFKNYAVSVRKELDDFAEAANKVLNNGFGSPSASNLSDRKLKVKVVDALSGASNGQYQDGTIYISADKITGRASAMYTLAHEFLHYLDDQITTETEREAFYKDIHEAMSMAGWGLEEWTDGVLRSRYATVWKHEAKRRGYNEEQTDAYIAGEVRQEVAARFISTLFGSTDIMNILALKSPDMLRELSAGLSGSGVSQLVNSSWDRARLKIMENINRVLTAPQSETAEVKAGAKEAEAKAFADLHPDIWEVKGASYHWAYINPKTGEVNTADSLREAEDDLNELLENEPDYFADLNSDDAENRLIYMPTRLDGFSERDGRYSRLARAISRIDGKIFADMFNYPNTEELLVRRLSRLGINKDEIKFSGLKDLVAELKKDPNTKAIGVSKSEFLDKLATDKYLYKYILQETEGTSQAHSSGPLLVPGTKGFQYETLGEQRKRSGTVSAASNYQEFLYTHPDVPAMSRHHKGNVLMSLRSSDYEVYGTGEKAFTLEEGQSDYHNAGAFRGYVDEYYEGNDPRNRDPKAERRVNKNLEKYNELKAAFDAAEPGSQERIDLSNQIDEVRSRIPQAALDNPDSWRSNLSAPYSDGGWVKYLAEQTIKKAAEGDYDYVAWSPENEIVNRYKKDKGSNEKMFRLIYGELLPSNIEALVAPYNAFIEKIPIVLTKSRATGNPASLLWVPAVKITDEMRNDFKNGSLPRWAMDLEEEYNLVESGPRSLGYNERSHRYSKLAKVISQMDDRQFRSLVNDPNPEKSLYPWLNKNGVTNEEIKYSGLTEGINSIKAALGGKITDKTEFLNRLRLTGLNDYALDENVLQANQSSYGSYTLDEEHLADLRENVPFDAKGYAFGDDSRPLGTNYQEHVFTNLKAPNVNDGHFPEFNGVVLHTRTKEYPLVSGNAVGSDRALFVEEVQSDLHNLGRAVGYVSEEQRANGVTQSPKMVAKYGPILDELTDLRRQLTDQPESEQTEEMYSRIRELEDQLPDEMIVQTEDWESLPEAPYAGDGYILYGAGQALITAAEEGLPYIAWSTPSIQESRWSDEFSAMYQHIYGDVLPKFFRKFGASYGVPVENIELALVESANGSSFFGWPEIPALRITEVMRKDLLEDGLPRWSFDLDDDYTMSDANRAEYESLKNRFGTMNTSRWESTADGRRYLKKFGGELPNQLDAQAKASQLLHHILTNENTAQSEAFKDSLRKGFLQGLGTHFVMSDDAARSYAINRIAQHKEISEAYSDVMNMLEVDKETGFLTRPLSKNDIAYAEQVLVDYAGILNNVESGENLAAVENKDPSAAIEDMQKLVARLCVAGTAAGQNLQAFSLLKKLTPTGRLYYIEQQMKALVSELVDKRGNSRIGGYRYMKDAKGNYYTVQVKKQNGETVDVVKPIQISDKLREAMLKCTTQEELDAVEDLIIDEIAAQLPPSLADRVVSWRYLAMLGNARTHLRNIVSNTVMRVTASIKDAVGGVLEDQAIRMFGNRIGDTSNGRTKSASALRNMDPEVRKALREFAEADWDRDNVKDITLSGGKIGFQSRINDRRNKLGIGNFTLLDKASKGNLRLLELQDENAAKKTYRRAFVSYCAANGLTADFFGQNTKASNTRLAQARSYAINEAAKATYHDASEVAALFNKLENRNALSKIIVGGLMPFKKTPINILKRGIEYSPVGLANGLIKFVQALNLSTEDTIFEEVETTKDGKKEVVRKLRPKDIDGQYVATDAKDALDSSKAELRYTAEAKKTLAVANAVDKLASGLTGTMLMVLGLLLAKMGLMKGSRKDNDREEYYDEMLGNQPYSITIGNRNYTLDWMTPVSMPLFAGVEMFNLLDNDDIVSFNDILVSVSKLADPVTNLSLLQGINDAISQYDSGLGKAVLSAAEGYTSQLIPTIAGQIARTVDPVRRTTFAPKEGTMLGKELTTFANRLKNKIPGLSQTNAEYVNMWGNSETTGDNVVDRFLSNAVAPWYTKDLQKTAADDLVLDIFAKTGDRSVIPTSPKNTHVINDETYYLTAKEYEQSKKLVGQLNATGITTLMEVPGFSDLDAETQGDLATKVYSIAQAISKEDYAEAHGIEYSPNTAARHIKDAVTKGLSFGAAVYVYYMANGIAGTKDANGKTISGSKKQNVLNFYHSLGLTQEQIGAISTYDYDFTS